MKLEAMKGLRETFPNQLNNALNSTNKLQNPNKKISNYFQIKKNCLR